MRRHGVYPSPASSWPRLARGILHVYLALLTVAGGSCDRGFGIGLTLELSCPINPAALAVTVTARPSNQQRTQRIDPAEPFLLGSHRLVVVPADGTSDIEAQIDALDGSGMRIGAASIDVAVSGHQLLERTLVVEPLACACATDSGACSACTGDIDCPAIAPICDLQRGECVVCLPDNDRCPAGQRCTLTNGVYHCATGCATDADCRNSDGGTLTSACCNNVCVDLATDNGNCHACGNACPPTGGCCDGACIDQSSDPSNCGGCHVVCGAPFAFTGCSGRACVVVGCQVGRLDCDHVEQNGCEVDPAGDVSNCGGCGMACTPNHSVPACGAGVCGGVCNAGFMDCNGNMRSDGCETDVETNPSSCGGCTLACSTSHVVMQSCTAGQCTGTCATGYSDCNGDKRGDGCETNTASDVANCGMCGKSCSLPNATAGCASGQCIVTTCILPFHDCDQVATNGCEDDVTGDNSNCGACGNACGNDWCVQSMCSKRVFVTSTPVTPDFPGLSGGDTICQTLASQVPLPGHYVAWLSSSTVSANTRVNGVMRPYVRVDGKVVAKTWSALLAMNHVVPVNITEQNKPFVDNYNSPTCPANAVWTGTKTGGVNGFASCSDWSSTAVGQAVTIGDADSSDTNLWTAECVPPDGCTQKAGIYCIQNDP